MPELIDPNRVWQVSLRVEGGEERINFYEAKERLVFKGAMLERLLDHASSRDNYAVTNAITSITSPEGDDYSGYAMFLLMFRVSGDVSGLVGPDHKYLFGVLEDGNVILVASENSKINQERFLQSLGVAVEKPESVEVLVLAFPVSVEPAAKESS